MFNTFNISQEEIISQLKISGQMPVVVEAIALRMAIAKIAKTAEITIEVIELQQAADKFRVAHNLELEQDTWQWLQEQEMSLNEFEEMLEATILATKLAQHLFADKVETFLVENYLNYTQVEMYEIILEDENLARELFNNLQQGELNFHAIAHEYIHDQKLRRVGGYRGLLHHSDLEPEIGSAVLAARPPQILNPIVTAKGVHLILVEEIIQPQLDDVLRKQIIADLFTGWVEQQLQEIKLVGMD